MTNSEYKQKYNEYLALAEEGLDSAFERIGRGAIYPKLSEAMRYSLEAGGKRLRPVLLLAVCGLMGGSVEKALPLACGLEMIHTYSLIHDDLPCMDDDDMRRGKPSNHKAFGEAFAVLAGDGLLSYAFETMLEGCLKLDPAEYPRYVRAMNEIAFRAGARGMVSGQTADIEFEGSAEQTEEALHYVHTHKTADMLCAAVLAGAYAAGADGKTIPVLEEYAQKLGLLFQITDDLLDMRGDPELVGKTLGKDSAAHKLTYAVLYGEEGAVKAAKQAADEAAAAAEKLPDNEFLIETINSILVRSF